MPFWDQGQWPWLERLAAVGVDVEDVDVVVHTHTHVDHVGWDTTLINGTWVPTFPNARYLYTSASLAWAADNDDPGMPGVYEDSIAPVVEAGLADVVADDHELGDGLCLVPAPGHTPGNVAVAMKSGAESAVVTGDFIHHPVQCAEPDWKEIGDVDPHTARVTRRRLLGQLAASSILVVGSHFPTASAGRIVAEGQQWRFLPVRGRQMTAPSSEPI